VLGAIGVVFGDIGTSPLYTLKEVFHPAHGVPLTPEHVLGVLSLVFWSMMLVVSFKYVLFILRADNRGEGGMLALTVLARRGLRGKPKAAFWTLLLGVFGASLFYGDSVITPAISVLSAVEGLEVAAPALKPFVIPITLGILIALFAVQRSGTARVGFLFGPVVALWFLTLAALGAYGISLHPGVLKALNPWYAAEFFFGHGLLGFLALGSVVLAITGAEALYADMGHFGARPIRYAWLGFVFPALTLNYFGQGALLLSNPAAVQNPFFLMAPQALQIPVLLLATAATVVASQAVITGAYSVTRAATQLGFLPRLRIIHTSEAIGQVYIPAVNWLLLAGIIALVLEFRSSSRLASAYGVAITTDMLITTVLAIVVMVTRWKWRWYLLAIPALFVINDLSFFAANLLKVADGGWFPLALAAGMFTVMTTWKRGRDILAARIREQSLPLRPFLESLALDPPQRVPGTSVFLSSSRDNVPHALLHNLKHNKVLHQRVVLLTVDTQDVPRVAPEEQVSVEALAPDIWRVVVKIGFKDEPDVPAALTRCRDCDLVFDPMDTSYFLSRETLIPTRRKGMALWREKLFVALSRISGSAMDFFRLPTNRVVELGAQIQL
jgi:KUP system potassium uptake protein